MFEDYLDYDDDLVNPSSHHLKPNHRRKKTEEQIIAEIAEPTGLEGGFITTYQPSRYEEGWLLSSLRSFYDQALLSDVLALVRGGKEASVYRCQAGTKVGVALVAAKVYRPRQFRSLRNDKMYREGRPLLTPDGRPVKKTDHRIMRAIGKKTEFGVQVQHTSWLMYEYTAMTLLHRVGAAVPRPIAASENAVLMGYCGDEHMAAPTLNEVDLGGDEAEALFQEVLCNVELMLQHDLIHGDLSAYNILYWEGKITLIDFPQVTYSRSNSRAHFILQRDIQRVCEYFTRQGVERDAAAIADDLWWRYVGIEPGQSEDLTYLDAEMEERS